MLGVAQLTRFYGVMPDDPDLVIVMRHRAVLFGMLGTLLVAAAFRSELRPLAYLAGTTSAGSFLAVACSVGAYNGLIGRVVTDDVVAYGSPSYRHRAQQCH